MEFPVYKKSNYQDIIVKFKNMNEGIVVSSNDSRFFVGYESKTWSEAGNESIWSEPTVEDLYLVVDNYIKNPEPEVDIGTKYHKQVPGVVIDVYDVLIAFDVTNPAIQHAVKKLLMPGLRGSKDKLKDLREAENSVKRAIAIEEWLKPENK